MAQFVGRITMEVAPSKLPSSIRRARLPRILETIMEDEKEYLESPRAPPHNAIRTKEVIDTPMYCADKLPFLVPMAKTECLKIKA
ncbi:unnamed protein product [Urochloa humidicola]